MYEVLFKKKPELKRLADLPIASMSFGACVSNDGSKIYIAGGTSGEKKKSMNETFEYDIEEDAWRKIGELNQPRFSSSLILFNSKLICLGGQD